MARTLFVENRAEGADGDHRIYPGIEGLPAPLSIGAVGVGGAQRLDVDDVIRNAEAVVPEAVRFAGDGRQFSWVDPGGGDRELHEMVPFEIFTGRSVTAPLKLEHVHPVTGRTVVG